MVTRKHREDLRQRTPDELALALRDAKRELFEVRTNIATRKEEDNNRSKMLRRRVARILTILAEKDRATAAAAADAGGQK